MDAAEHSSVPKHPCRQYFNVEKYSGIEDFFAKKKYPVNKEFIERIDKVNIIEEKYVLLTTLGTDLYITDFDENGRCEFSTFLEYAKVYNSFDEIEKDIKLLSDLGNICYFRSSKLMTEMAKQIKVGDFVNDYGYVCYVVLIDVNYTPARVVLVNLKGEMLMQDINSLELMAENQLNFIDTERLKDWADRAIKRYRNINDPNVPEKEPSNQKI